MTIKELINEAKYKFESGKLTYDELSEITGISRSVLNRMFNGKLCPKSSGSKSVKRLMNYVGNVDVVDNDPETIFDTKAVGNIKREMLLRRLSTLKSAIDEMEREIDDILHFVEKEI